MSTECGDYSQWSVSKLKSQLQQLGFTTTGSKESLVSRLEMLAPETQGNGKKEKVPSAKGLKAKPAAAEKAKTAQAATAQKLKATKAAAAEKAKAPAKVAKGETFQKSAAKAKLTRTKASAAVYDLGDLHSPAASLHRCLRGVPTVEVMQALVGPGPCLLKALSKTPPAKLRSMVEANEFECQAAKTGGISLQQRLAIRLYTAEAPIPLYRALNSPFHSQSRTPSSIANQAPFMKLLLQAVQALKKAGKAFSYVGPAYRGVKVANSPLLKKKYTDHAEAFRVGSRLTFAAFTSLSLVDSTAESFGDRILFQFTRVHGVRVAELSAIPSELEILVEPPAVFEVKSCAKFHGVLSVVLEAVDSPLKYL